MSGSSFREWTREELLALRRLYGGLSDVWIAKALRRNLLDVIAMAKVLGLGKDKKIFPGDPMPRWTKGHIRQLRKIYSDTSNVAIAQILGRSSKSIVSKAGRLGLEKSSRHRSRVGRSSVFLRDDR